MTKVFIAISHRLYLLFIWIGQEKEFSVTDFANFAANLLAIFKSDGAREGSGARSTVLAINHGTEFTLDRFLEALFACKAICLFTMQLVARCIISHLKFKYYILRVKRKSRSVDMDCHDLLHHLTLITSQAFVLFLNLKVSFIGEALNRLNQLTIRCIGI